MKHSILYLSIITIFFDILANNSFSGITKTNYKQSHINNTIEEKTIETPIMIARYNIIQDILNQYKRPFTMLDIGAGDGYQSLTTAYNYPHAICVMIESDDTLFDICKTNKLLNNIILLQKTPEEQDLQRLSECEHFDVILALDIFYSFSNNWQQITDAILNMGDNIIIEVPPQELAKTSAGNNIHLNLENYLLTKNTMAIGKIRQYPLNIQSTLYLVQSSKKYLERNTWIMPKIDDAHKIYSTFTEKKLIKTVRLKQQPHAIVESTWQPGINLITFKMYHGSYPLIEDIQVGIHNLSHVNQNDWMPNNMVLQGKNLIFIDLDDPSLKPGGFGAGRRYTKKFEKLVQEWITLQIPQQIESFFWERLGKG